MNIAFPFLLPARLPACLPVCPSKRLPGLMPAFCGIQWKYPVQLHVDSWQGWRHSAFEKTPTVCQAANARQLLLVCGTETCSKKNVTSRPSDTHCGRILCQLECRELKKGGGTVSKTENKLSPSTDYYWGRCLGVWNCVLRSMCGLAPLCFILTHNQAGFTSILYLLILSFHQRYCRSC